MDRFYLPSCRHDGVQNARRELKGQRPLAHFADLDRRKMQIALTQVAEKGAIFPKQENFLGTRCTGPKTC